MSANLGVDPVYSRPHAGAWIETPLLSGPPLILGRPHAGAWIETLSEGQRQPGGERRPHAGAWIETDSYGRVS